MPKLDEKCRTNARFDREIGMNSRFGRNFLIGGNDNNHERKLTLEKTTGTYRDLYLPNHDLNKCAASRLNFKNLEIRLK